MVVKNTSVYSSNKRDSNHEEQKMSSDNSVSSNTPHSDQALFKQAEQLELEHIEQIAEVPAHEEDKEDIADAQPVQESAIVAEPVQENEPQLIEEQPNVEEQKIGLNF